MKAYRGQQILFEKLLSNPDGTSIQPGKQVQVRVEDPNRKVVYAGTAQYNLDLASYSFIFIVPQDAPLSTIDSSWTVDWCFVGQDGSVVDLIAEFDVVLEDVNLPEQTILLNEMSPLETISFFVPDRPTALDVVAFDSGNMVVFRTQNPNDFNVTPTANGFLYELRIDTTTFQVPPPMNADYTNLNPTDTFVPVPITYQGMRSNTGDYVFRLTARIPNHRGMHVENVLVRIVSNNFWKLYPSLQMLLDRARKRPDMINSYTDSDYYEAITRGIAMVNISAPQMTNWTLEDFPLGGRYWGQYDLSHYLLAGAALWLLQAQIVAYGEIGFNFTGQTVTLDYDPSVALGGVIESFLNELNVKLPRAKNLIVKATHHMAIVGIRQQFYNHQLSRLDIFRRGLGYQGFVNAPMIGARFLF